MARHGRIGWLFGLILLPGLAVGCALLMLLYLRGEGQLEAEALQSARAISAAADAAMLLPALPGGAAQLRLPLDASSAAAVLRAAGGLALPEGWIVALLDGAGIVRARNIGPEFVGRYATPDLLAALERGGEGMFGSRTLEGRASFLAYHRSARTGWTVVVAAPVSVLLAGLRQALTVTATAVAMAMVAGVLMAWVFWRRTLDPLQRLSSAVERLGTTGEPVRVAVSGPYEVATLAQRFNEMVAAREVADAQLRLAASVFEATSEGILIVSADERILEANRAFQRMSGYSRAELVGSTPRLLHSGRHDRAFYEAMWNVLRTTGQWQGQVWDRRRDGSLFAALLTISAKRDVAGAISHYVALFTDITEQRRRQDEVERLANCDPLTGLANRRVLNQQLEIALARADACGGWVAVCTIDLDGFKAVNDARGHDAGDAVLVAVAQRLRQVVRDEDTVARIGGDEFVLLLAGPDGETGAMEIARRALAAIDAPVQVPAAPGRTGYATVGASIGVAVYPADGHDAPTLLRHSDAAMYRAKRGGRNRIVTASAA